MARTDSQKNSRSSRFENPANCETLFRRTSMSRTRPGRRSLTKNSRADFLVKPMVKIFKSRPPPLKPSAIPDSLNIEYPQPASHTRERSVRPCCERDDFPECLASAADVPAKLRDLPVSPLRECGRPGLPFHASAGRPKFRDDKPGALSRRTAWRPENVPFRRAGVQCRAQRLGFWP